MYCVFSISDCYESKYIECILDIPAGISIEAIKILWEEFKHRFNYPNLGDDSYHSNAQICVSKMNQIGYDGDTVLDCFFVYLKETLDIKRLPCVELVIDQESC